MSKYIGTDVNLEIALEEQGFVCTQLDNRDFRDEYQVIYKMDHHGYGVGYIRSSELDKLVRGQEWASKKDVASFLSSLGLVDKASWMSMSFPNKLSTLLDYWGWENIMGTDYYPWDKETAYRKIGLWDEEK
jgi:hypothetical protein